MQITEVLGNFLVPVIIGICAIVGYLIKNQTPIANNYIPTIVTVLGLALSVWMNGIITPEVILTGMASGLISTGCHQLIKTWLEKVGNSSDS